MVRILYLLVITTLVSCQHDFGKLKILASFPNEFVEISGIEKMPNSNLLWFITDGGSDAKVYTYDLKTKKMGQRYALNQTKNVDWEDLTSDTKGTLFIGDFGNNDNTRTDLTIYKIKNIANATPQDSVTSAITFTLSDQTEFPPKKKDRNYDIEAFFYFKNNLYLFTRNRSKNFDGTTKLYRLPATAGAHTAQLIGQYKTCEDRGNCQITAAAIEQTTGNIALLSYDKLWLIDKYQGDAFFDGNIKEIKLDHMSQKESITFKNKHTVYIADERNGPDGGNLYEFDLRKN